ncbi:uncharacterized protein LOC111328701 [Stylophora pistillata]|uniref:uncharacterized protein LOC111328701 n=1 Tax=Stylophora pistillata TaxID=50429 RepID=UPI000C0547A1|nr:uncharacterized protein LOC111328701 [Stylophora pistillata]
MPLEDAWTVALPGTCVKNTYRLFMQEVNKLKGTSESLSDELRAKLRSKKNGRVQVKMPWKESGPPKQSNYGIALRRMYSAEKLFKNKDCFEIVDQEVQKLVDQGFVIKVASDNIDHDQPEWYLRLQAVFTPEKSRQVRLVFDSSCKGYHGLSLNDHLEKGLNYINSLPNVLIAWRWDEVAYAGDIRRCSTKYWYTRMTRSSIGS